MGVRYFVRIDKLSDRAVRLAYVPEGSRLTPTFAAQTLDPRPISMPVNGCLELFDGGLSIKTKPDGRLPRADNLALEWECRGRTRTWRPGQLDRENLGAPFLSLDNIWRAYIPSGVHPADPLAGYDEAIRDGATLTRAIETRYNARHGCYPDHSDRNAELERYLDGRPPELFDQWPEQLREAREIVRHSPPGLLTRSGLSIIRDTTLPWNVDRRWIDKLPEHPPLVLYLVYHECDWKLACRELIGLFGPPPKIPPFLLGIWYSKYSRLGAADVQRVADEFDARDLPLNTLSVDMDWHGSQWWAYQWNEQLFPDPPAFAQWLRSRDLRATFNIHPIYIPPDDPCIDKFVAQSGHSGERLGPSGDWHPDQHRHIKVDLYDRRQAEAYMRLLHKPIRAGGCNFWWVDGWIRRPDGREECSWLNHVYRQHLIGMENQTPIVLSRAAGLGAHRDVILFTGDACSQWEVLEFEIEASVRASGALMPYVSHDIGGFYHDPRDRSENNPPDDLYARWVQFGCLSSIMRLHSLDGVREPWRFSERVLRITRHFMRLRMRLLPYLCELVEQAHATGLPLVRPMWFEFDDETAYECLGQYMLGDALLVVPVAREDSAVRYWLPPGTWHDAFGSRVAVGPKWIEQTVPLEIVPLWLHSERAIELGQPHRRANDVLAGPRETVTGGGWAIE